MTLSPGNTLYAKTLIGVLAIANPLGAIPIFLSLCSDRTSSQRKKVAQNSAIAVAVILILATWVGDGILEFFGIGIPAFRAGGGLLILVMAISMMHAKRSHARQTPSEADEADNKENVAVVPLAIPLMAGPGAFSLVIIDANQMTDWISRLILTGGILGVALIVWIALRLATPIGQRMGTTGLNSINRQPG